MANSLKGQLGSTTSSIRVFQDFFADLDLPVYLTQNDETSIPVAIRNYTKKMQKVIVVLKEEDWFTPLSDTKITVSIKPGHSAGVNFRIQAIKVGKAHKIEVAAITEDGKTGDRLMRKIEVIPDGYEQLVNFSDIMSSDNRKIKHAVFIPPDAIDGASTILVRAYPGFFSQVIEGLDNIIRMPSGCFEQTSSIAYPNILAATYIKKAGIKLPPERMMKIETFLRAGYQRLLTFECPSGGFEWWGKDPAVVYLTAYGVMEFGDMKTVLPDVDYSILDRVRNFLFKQQGKDGSWSEAKLKHKLRIKTDPKLALTSYVIWCILESGYPANDPKVQKAIKFIRNNYAKVENPYHLALCANALLSANSKDKDGIAILNKLEDKKLKDDKGRIYWSSANTIYSGGKCADIETTAMIVLAFLKAQRNVNLVNKSLEWLISMKDPYGTWGSTQATILALKALIQSTPGSAFDTNAEITVKLNGKEVHTFIVTPENSDVYQQKNLKPHIVEGNNELEIIFEGKGAMMYQIVGKYYLPWHTRPQKKEPFGLTIEYDKTTLCVNDLVTCKIKLVNNQPSLARMVMLDIGVPPGFKVISTDLDLLVEDGKIMKYDLTSRQVIIYLEALGPNETLELSYRLQAKYPIRARSRASKAYEYYTPENKAIAGPQKLEVKEAK
jgi:uncharacterized protein YfaS (alpha-2-macroglobulin family)